MTRISRREFGAIAMAAAPLAVVARPRGIAARSGAILGVTTSSFRELPRVTGQDNVDDVLRALKSIRVTDIDLSLSNVEPAPPSVAPFMGGTPAYPRRIVLSPEEVASTNRRARAEIATWRLHTGVHYFESVRAKFAAAGITLHAVSLALDESFSDQEIDATFRQIKALGVNMVASPLTMTTASRLVPFAERHRLSIAIHNQAAGNAAGSVTSSDLASALRLSPAFGIKMDVGNITASNRDAVAEFTEHHARVSYVVIKDRLQNGGASQPLGEGDTPIAKVLGRVKSSARPVPVFIEYDYVGLRPAVDEVAASIKFVGPLVK